MKLASVIIGVLGIILTIKPFIRIGDFPRVQVLITLILSLFLLAPAFEFAGYFDTVFTVLVSVCIFYQVQTILPFTPLYRKQVQPARKEHDYEASVSLLIFNVLMENENYDCALRMIEASDADVVLLAEPDENWARSLAPLHTKYPHAVSCPLDNRYGMILFSRLPLEDTELQFLIQDDIPSIHTQVVLPCGRSIALHGVHPRPPI